jgi:glutathione synthase/RimK-type ligase-like ATP-grasp enzyme
MPTKSNITTDHEQIRQWVEERGGHPAAVKRTRGSRGRGDDTGILRIDFPGYSGQSTLEEISWDEFFEKFDRENLAFLYQDQTARGQKSNFNKIIRNQQNGGARGRSRSGAGRKTASRGSRGRTRKTTTSRKRATGQKRSSGNRSTTRKRAAAKKKTSTRKSGRR